MKRFAVLLCGVSIATCFQWFNDRPYAPTPRVSTRKVERKISDCYYKKYLPYNDTESKQCLFFTGGNSYIPVSYTHLTLPTKA